jgi:UDP-N-acetylmuramoyl-L-alanyl-D-glutamate--2,6-diaminopimelate ligase
MLNEKKLSTILSYQLPQLNLSDIHWKSQDSTETSILFYKILPDEKSKDLFVERIQKSKFGWLVLNVDHPKRPVNSCIVAEKDWPRVQKEILDELYPLPKIKMVAITGTNGKTTTADLVLQLGHLIGKKGLSIGTLGVREYNKTLLDFGLTSPSFIDLRKFLAKFGVDKDFCVLEASSHALIQDRLYGLQFDAGGWLSFSQDHLDYHHSMEEYFKAKLLLFNFLKSGAKVFVPHEQKELFLKIKSFSSEVQETSDISEKLPLFFRTKFNRNNLEVAFSIIKNLYEFNGYPDFNKLITPDGRFYIREYKTNYIVVDFAHTPDALENICQGINEAFPTHRLKVLFGCGGDRDRTKRPMMGKIAETFGSEVYLTSDNPRSENPDQIIDDIYEGMSSTHVKKIVDRKKAVQLAFSELKENEILLLAGKGHEDYILINGVKHPYSDIAEVEDFLLRKKI